MKRMKEEMMKREERLNQLLKDRGLQIQYIEKRDNNQILDGYMILERGESISPTVYYDPEWYDLTDMEAAAYLADMGTKKISLDIQNYLKPEYVLSHVRPMLLGAANIEGIEESGLLYYQDENFLILFYEEIDFFSWSESYGEGIIKINQAFCEYTGIDPEEIFRQAFENLEHSVEVISLERAIQMCLQQAMPEPDEIKPPVCPLYVVTNEKHEYGAAEILSKEAYRQISAILGEKFIVFPSSIHECIVAPYNEKSDLSYFTQIVQYVNITEVRREEWLTDHAFIYDGKKMEKIP